MQATQALAGRTEDKWIEFVAAEFAGRRGTARLDAKRALVQALRPARAAGTMRRVEVHASYVWLLAGAVVAWVIG